MPQSAAAVQGSTDAGIHHHHFADGEVLRFFYEDTDTVFQTVGVDGTIQAGNGIEVQEMQIPVDIQVRAQDGGLMRALTILPEAQYREAAPNALAQTQFQILPPLIPGYQTDFSYTYKDDTDAMSRLQDIFSSIRSTNVGSFLFFKDQDIHQMQQSAEQIPEGLLPGPTSFTEPHDVPGLGGDFKAAASQLIYQGVQDLEGQRAGYFKVISLGNQFTTSTMTTFTNFFFTMYVALDGPKQGLLLDGEGQETATVLQPTPAGSASGGFTPLVALQRQFSIRLK